MDNAGRRGSYEAVSADGKTKTVKNENTKEMKEMGSDAQKQAEEYGEKFKEMQESPDQSDVIAYFSKKLPILSTMIGFYMGLIRIYNVVVDNADYEDDEECQNTDLIVRWFMFSIFTTAPMCITIYSAFNDIHQYVELQKKIKRKLKRQNTAAAEKFQESLEDMTICSPRTIIEGVMTTFISALVLTIIEVRPIDCIVKNAKATIFVAEAILFTIYLYAQNADKCTSGNIEKLADTFTGMVDEQAAKQRELVEAGAYDLLAEGESKLEKKLDKAEKKIEKKRAQVEEIKEQAEDYKETAEALRDLATSEDAQAQAEALARSQLEKQAKKAKKKIETMSEEEIRRRKQQALGIKDQAIDVAKDEAQNTRSEFRSELNAQKSSAMDSVIDAKRTAMDTAQRELDAVRSGAAGMTQEARSAATDAHFQTQAAVSAAAENIEVVIDHEDSEFSVTEDQGTQGRV